MSSTTLQALRETYPGRFGLRAEEVALVLRGTNSRGVVQRVREGMKHGRYPGAKKVDGLWQLPLSDLADIIDPAPVSNAVIPSPSTSAAVSRTGRRKSAIGPRLALIRAFEFWSQVCASLGYQEEALEMEGQNKAMRADGKLARNWARAEEQAAKLDQQTAQASGPLATVRVP
jgi:hypothetical protein